MFSWKDNNDIKYLEIEEFKAEGVTAIFTSRQGGVSKGCYESLNLAFHTDDKKENILKNRQLISETLNLNHLDLTAAEQVHGNQIYIVNEKDCGRGALAFDKSIPGIDALITDKTGLPLISFYADCVPLFFLDPVNRAAGLAHAGWKGTVLRIGARTLKRMTDEYGTCPEDCVVGIGPAISADKYEVDEPVVARFRNEFSFWQDIVIEKGNGYFNLNLALCNQLLLEESGVRARNIIQSNLCTYSSADKFYSYRRDGGRTGRMASILIL